DPRYVGIGKGPSDDHNARAACGHETAEGAPDAARSANDGNLQSLEVEARSIDATPCKALVSLHRVRVPLAPPTAHRCAAIEPSTHFPTASFMSAFTLGSANGGRIRITRAQYRGLRSNRATNLRSATSRPTTVSRSFICRKPKLPYFSI